MRVFVFEHLCGGGMLGEHLRPDLTAQGIAMLKAALADFRAVGVAVTTCLDERVRLAVDGIETTVVRIGQAIEPIFDELASTGDAALVIAPETDGVLESWLTRLESLGVISLGCGKSAVALCADKLKLAEHLQLNGIPTPPTHPADDDRDACFPCIVKPRYGAGCEETFLCRSWREAGQLRRRDGFITQPAVGRSFSGAASVSLIVHDQQFMPLLAGRQYVELDSETPPRLHYAGGSMPLPEPWSTRARDLAVRAASTVPSLRGFVGVDLMMGDDPDRDTVIEINPRLTVSYVALQRLCRFNMASAMIGTVGPPEQGAADLDPSSRFHDRLVHYDAAGNIVDRGLL